MLYHPPEIGPIAFVFKRIGFFQKIKTFIPWKLELFP